MRTGEIKTQLENFKDIRRFMVDTMKSNGATTRDVTETLLIFEALYNDMLNHGISGDTDIIVSGNKSFGDLTISIGFEGSMYVPMSKKDDDDAESMVMGAYGDKIEHSYHSGFNNLSITVTRHVSKTIMYCIVAIILAVLIYLVLSYALNRDAQTTLLSEIILPVEKLFANAVLMVGAPVTFFSLLKNMTDLYIETEKNSEMRRIRRGILSTSVLSALLAIVIGIGVKFVIGSEGAVWFRGLSASNTSLSDILTDIMPPSIFAPFESLSPLPMIILASLVIYAFCHAGRYFDGMKRVTDACYTLFSKMLSVVMYTIPFFCFAAMLDVQLDGGFKWMLYVLAIAVFMIASLVIPASLYSFRLWVHGVETGPFIRKMIPLLKENFAINSAIDAAPYNIRYCTINYGMDRKGLEEKLPMLAQLNLDGNCFIITLATMLFIIAGDISVTWIDLMMIALMVVFLSLGAPNQPGSVLIGMTIIINYLNAYDMIAVAIYLEVFLGSIVNLINVTGDIVTVAIEDGNLKSNNKKAVGA